MPLVHLFQHLPLNQHTARATGVYAVQIPAFSERLNRVVKTHAPLPTHIKRTQGMLSLLIRFSLEVGNANNILVVFQ